MRNRNTNAILRGVSILFLTGALILGIVSLIGYSRQRNNYPVGMSIAGVPVGGLTPAEASQRLLEVYTSPVEVLYNDAIIHIDPGVVGFEADVETMLAAADLSRTGILLGRILELPVESHPARNHHSTQRRNFQRSACANTCKMKSPRATIFRPRLPCPSPAGPPLLPGTTRPDS